MSLELDNVSLQAGRETFIYPTSLQLVAGEFNILLGTTLAGKTSLMRLMAGLEKPSSGRVLFDGVDVTREPIQKRNVAMVYQQFVNYPNFTVYDNIASPMRLLGKSRKEIDAAIHEVADLLQLTPMLKRMPNELSGGQQQRTALARALVKRARLVLLDEPLANLDYKLREELREELPRLFRDSGATVVYATTEPTEALLLGGHTATLFEGRVVQHGPTGAVYRQPAGLLSAQVFSDPPMNTASVRKRGSEFELAEFDLQPTAAASVRWPAVAAHSALPDGDYQLGVRPHHVTLTPSSDHAVAVKASVLLTEISGSESTVHASLGTDSTWISLSHGIHPLERGEAVTLYFDPGRSLLFDGVGGVVSAEANTGSAQSTGGQH